VTRRLRKVLCRPLAEVELLVLPELPVPEVGFVAAACACSGAAIAGVIPWIFIFHTPVQTFSVKP
jgi:hypothetical protein